VKHGRRTRITAPAATLIVAFTVSALLAGCGKKEAPPKDYYTGPLQPKSAGSKAKAVNIDR
jgi:hypothetical protein